MRSLIALAAIVLTLSLSSIATAQFSYQSNYSFGRDPVVRHQCDVAHLREYVADLGIVCQNLNSDARRLSHGYANSAEIKNSVAQLENLKIHMHRLLSRIVDSNSYTASVDALIKSDTAEVRNLLTRFYNAVAGQASVGACPSDQNLLHHMEEVIVNEAFPLLGRLESELYGATQGTLCPSDYGVRSSSRIQTSTLIPGSHLHQQRRTSYRTPVPVPPSIAPSLPIPPGPVPPFVSRLMRQSGHPAFTPSSRYSSSRSWNSSPAIRLGNLRIQF